MILALRRRWIKLRRRGVPFEFIVGSTAWANGKLPTDRNWYAIATDPFSCPACGRIAPWVTAVHCVIISDDPADLAPQVRIARDVGRNPRLVTYDLDAGEPVMTLREWRSMGRPAHGTLAKLGSAEPIDPAPENVDEGRCYRHPKESTALRCRECNRFICADCSVHGPVGISCPACAGKRHVVRRGGIWVRKTATVFGIIVVVGWQLLNVLGGPGRPAEDQPEYRAPVTHRPEQGRPSGMGKWHEPVTLVSAERALRSAGLHARRFSVEGALVHHYATSHLARESAHGYSPEQITCNVRIETRDSAPRGPFHRLTRAFHDACADDPTLDAAQTAVLVQRTTRADSGAITGSDGNRSSHVTIQVYATATAATVIAQHDAAYWHPEHLERAVCNTVIVSYPARGDKPTSRDRQDWEGAAHEVGRACGEDTSRPDTRPPEPRAEKYWAEADVDDAAANAADPETGEPAGICDLASPPQAGRITEAAPHDPPTSGILAATPARWGLHEQQPGDARVLRNLQQGGVAVWYGEHFDEWRRELGPLISRHKKIIAAPREGLPENEIIATGYGLLYRCTRVRNIPNLVRYLERGFIRATVDAEPLDRLPRRPR